MMGYETPNIGRIAKEGMFFTDAYGEQSCTAGRIAFITGQLSVRTGLTKVSLPGVGLGMQPEDPTLAEYLKSKGYAAGQFGKNHFGDCDEHPPTNHGFDEIFGQGKTILLERERTKRQTIQQRCVQHQTAAAQTNQSDEPEPLSNHAACPKKPDDGQERTIAGSREQP